MRKLIELRRLAIGLYNGDWRSNDREELKVIFRLSEYELDIICEDLLKYESEVLTWKFIFHIMKTVHGILLL